MGKRKEMLLGLVCLVLLTGICIPLLAVAGYNYPQGDDLGYGADVYRLLREGRGIPAALQGAFKVAYDTWFSWQGSFSAIFLMALQPGVFGEQYYRLGTWILLGTLLCSEFVFLRRVFYENIENTSLVSLWALISAVQILMVPHPNESFFWYNGSIYYTFFFSISLLLFSEILVLSRENITGLRGGAHLLAAVFLAVFAGGGNLATGMGNAVLITVYAAICFLSTRRFPRKIMLVWSVYLASFLINVSAPGNRVRQMEQSKNIPPAEAVWLAVYHSLKIILQWFDIRLVLILIICIPFLWKLVRAKQHRYPLPGVFSLLAFGIYASMMTPISRVNGSYGPNRMVNIFWYGCVFLLVAIEGYWIGWLQTKQDFLKRFARIKNFAGRHCIGLQMIVLIMFGGSILASDNYMDYSSYVAYRALRNGYAVDFAEEFEERLQVLLDDSVCDVYFQEFINRTEPLFYCDISEDSEDYFNISMAEYYGKRSVHLAE